MKRLAFAVCVAAIGSAAAAQSDTTLSLTTVLQRAGERVERYLLRAQSLVCLEVVYLQPLTSSWSTDGFGRTVESELRLSWPGGADTAGTDAQTVRQVVRVNGGRPQPDDWRNCTTPEQESKEPQALSLLLPAERGDYRFTLAGEGRIDRRRAIMIDYRFSTPASVESHMVEGREDCVSFDIDGGTRGRLWIDAETFEVLRLDRNLTGMVEIPLPRPVRMRPSSPVSWTMERWDTSIRFKTLTFSDPDETLVLPVSSSSLQITRGAGTPRLRTQTEYKNYQRFLTGGRVVGN
jgi:hypothetical protein